MYQEIVIATNNKNKVREYREIFKEYPLVFYSLDDLNLQIDPDETGSSYEENALIKARECAKYVSLPIIADDSGLEISAFDNNPGIYSARYSKTFVSQKEANLQIVKELEGETNRQAKFVCVIVLYVSKNKCLVFRGETNGKIVEKLEGNNGFGYDPIFLEDDTNKTYAAMSKDEKNKVSHRAKASKKLKTYLLFNNCKL